ncbi:type I methionyl aminopeptidase [Candidatus Bipolaricaulota bacterium]|nr:type I methionyl aminopeptidase [Candidatus Bipolaricaulota bacterium]
MIKIKSSSELEIMKENASILRKILDKVVSRIELGVTTQELDSYAEDLIHEADGTPAFKNYRGFPSSLCTSLNEEIVHGIPGRRKLESGDLLSLDIGIERDGLFADFATTVAVGKVTEKAMGLMSVTDKALTKGIDKVAVGNRVGDISHVIGSFVNEEGYHVVKEFVGHGIGRDMHEDPQIPNYGEPDTGKRIEEGMVFCIEPMVKLDDKKVEVLDDGWTTVTADRDLSAHFEGMVAATKDGPEVLVRGGL